MIKAISSSKCTGITECQVELKGPGKEILKEYRAITTSVYGYLCKCIPKDIAKDILMEEMNKAIAESVEV